MTRRSQHYPPETQGAGGAAQRGPPAVRPGPSVLLHCSPIAQSCNGYALTGSWRYSYCGIGPSGREGSRSAARHRTTAPPAYSSRAAAARLWRRTAQPSTPRQANAITAKITPSTGVPIEKKMPLTNAHRTNAMTAMTACSRSADCPSAEPARSFGPPKPGTDRSAASRECRAIVRRTRRVPLQHAAPSHGGYRRSPSAPVGGQLDDEPRRNPAGPRPARGRHAARRAAPSGRARRHPSEAARQCFRSA